MNINNTIERMEKDCKEFAKQGGNVALFWAGRMSQVSFAVCTSTAKQLSDNICLLDAVRERYDDEIMRRTYDVSRP